ncbi:MAG: hypothetical protein MUE61_14655 [Vicinamibacterales bacterium]|jgi:hypothetical protein|nr:hypothetical protein [Vicinamibacterales bacterium]
MAAVARGVPRLTRDIDATIEAEGLDVDGALALLRQHGFEPRIEHAAEFDRLVAAVSATYWQPN